MSPRLPCLLVISLLGLQAVLKSTAATEESRVAPASVLAPEPALARYRAELTRFRQTFGGARDMPDERFFLFGMGLREKLLYRKGELVKALSGEIVRRWTVREDFLLPADYTVVIRTTDNRESRIVEDERGVWLVDGGVTHRISKTEAPVRLPDFAAYPFPAVLRVLHQELLVNVTPRGPVPNYFVYSKPWYRDGAMMAMVFKETGNLDCIRPWILGLESVFDRNNAGETEADNPGQVLYLLSLVSDRNHPLVPKVLAEAASFESTGPAGKFLQGRSDFATHPVYQTKWMKYGLRALDLPDPYTVPPVADSYAALFWMDFRETHVPGRDADDRDRYPYLGWACDHFHGARKSPISNRDYPLTWEAHASQARYEGIKPLSETYADGKLAAPHTWHAAEVLLYFLKPIP